MDHQVPGTYILRHLSDVAIPEPVSWWPQTVGWKVLLAVAILGRGDITLSEIQENIERLQGQLPMVSVWKNYIDAVAFNL